MKKIAEQSLMIQEIAVKCKTRRSLDYALLVLEKTKTWLNSFSYWYWDSDYSTIQESMIKYHLRSYGQEILIIRRLQIRDVYFDIKQMCEKLKEYTVDNVDCKGLDLIIAMGKKRTDCHDKFLSELWANMYV